MYGKLLNCIDPIRFTYVAVIVFGIIIIVVSNPVYLDS
jgi:hypothetical protein